jgi:hypothetical protein
VLPHFIAEVEGRLRVDLPIGMLPDAADDDTRGRREEPGA